MRTCVRQSDAMAMMATTTKTNIRRWRLRRCDRRRAGSSTRRRRHTVQRHGHICARAERIVAVGDFFLGDRAPFSGVAKRMDEGWPAFCLDQRCLRRTATPPPAGAVGATYAPMRLYRWLGRVLVEIVVAQKDGGLCV